MGTEGDAHSQHRTAQAFAELAFLQKSRFCSSSFVKAAGSASCYLPSSEAGLQSEGLVSLRPPSP